MNRKTFIGLLLVAILYSCCTVVIHVHQAVTVNSRITDTRFCDGKREDRSRELPTENINRVLPNENINTGLPTEIINRELPTENINTGLPNENIKRGLLNENINKELPNENNDRGLPIVNINRGLPTVNINRVLPIQNTTRLQTVNKNPSDIIIKENTLGNTHSTNTMVVIHSYQRCGSSFFGDMFDHHPDAFYHFEPLDALYSHLYGTCIGWNVPDDLFFYENGTRRILTDIDSDHVAEFLDHLLTCQINKLPTELLTHVYVAAMPEYFTSISDFVKCSVNITKAKVHVCPDDAVLKYCGKRYGMVSHSHMHTCNHLLNDPNTTKTDEPVNITLRQAFKDFKLCYSEIRRQMDDSCSNKLLLTCRSRTIRATKLVRASMKSTGKLLKAHPNLYVIYLMRDPRVVSISRLKFHSSVMGRFSSKAVSDRSIMLLREASMYCRLALDDIMERLELEKKYPGRVISIMYEEFVKDIPVNIRKIYDFIKQPLNEKAFNQIYNKMSNKTQTRNTNVNKESNSKINNTIQYFKTLKLLNDSMINTIVNRNSKVISKTQYLETLKVLNDNIFKMGLNKKAKDVDRTRYLDLLKLLQESGPNIGQFFSRLLEGKSNPAENLFRQNNTELPPSVNIATKWQQQIGEALNDQILFECREFYENIKLGVKL